MCGGSTEIWWVGVFTWRTLVLNGTGYHKTPPCSLVAIFDPYAYLHVMPWDLARATLPLNPRLMCGQPLLSPPGSLP